MKKITQQIDSFSYSLTDSALESVKMLVLDTVSAMVMGAAEEEIQRLIQTIKHYDTGNFSILGDANTFSLSDAAFLLGTASVAVELDEGNQWSKGHPAVHVLPVLLLHAQLQSDYSGPAFIDDLIRSYEACTYFGKITSLKPDMHAHGTWGVLGSAVALSLANKADTASLARLLNLAATFATPTKWTAALEGAGIRNVYIGESIIGGLRAWQLASSGYYAPQGNATSIYSTILGNDFFLEEPYDTGFLAIENNYFKQHAFCRYVHVPLEAFQSLVEQYQFQADQIENIHVATYARAATLRLKITENSLSSKFSIPFALSSWFFEKKSDHTVFQEQLYLKEEIRELATKITVIHNPELDKNYPDFMPAVVTVTLTDGQILEKHLNHAFGGPQEKSNLEIIEKKFTYNTKNLLTSRQQEKLIRFVRELEHQTSIKEIYDLVNKT